VFLKSDIYSKIRKEKVLRKALLQRPPRKGNKITPKGE
jgi:hypothetical protein